MTALAPSWMASVRAAGGGLLDLLLPAACVICRRPHRPDVDGIVCALCLSRLVPLTYPLCDRCGHPLLSLSVPLPDGRRAARGDTADTPPDIPTSSTEIPPCRWCARLSPALRAVRSVTRMDTGTGGDLVHALKYQGWSRAALAMGRRMARLDWPLDVREERTALIPIPLAAERLRERGYNQATLLAQALGPLWRLPVWPDALMRIRHTQSQVRLTPSERTSNVSQAFAVPRNWQARLRGQHVVLVDDVITTAATVNAAVHALLDGGARIISCVTFGRAPDPGDRTAPDSDFTRN
ncbi:ComF family protein [Gemmatimonas sp.]|jgi:ComF family protein|uniref:ComF family protein n=1 Tax=Gemmatimonas sp. TaxID=1962908 RepID=UPI0037BEE1BB